MIEYFIYEGKYGGSYKYFVAHEDENGEIWDADPEGFESHEEALKFLREIQELQDSTET